MWNLMSGMSGMMRYALQSLLYGIMYQLGTMLAGKVNDDDAKKQRKATAEHRAKTPATENWLLIVSAACFVLIMVLSTLAETHEASRVKSHYADILMEYHEMLSEVEQELDELVAIQGAYVAMLERLR